MEKFGFFNAKNIGGVYDRKYNANDYSENLAVIISNGVLRSINDDLKVTANAMTVSVGVGRAWINGHYYLNDSVYTFPTTQAPTGGNRIDRVVLRFNNDINERNIKLIYLQGTASVEPGPPEITRNDTIFDLVLANINVYATSTNVVVDDQRSNKAVCGWVYSTSGDGEFFTSLDNQFHNWFTETKDEVASVTLFKRYQWSTTLESATNIVQFDIPQYNADTCFVEVFANGFYLNENDEFTLSNNIINFANTHEAGTEINVNVYKSIDGTGINSVTDEITTLQNQMQEVQGNAKYTYVCTGLNDNISISEIVETIIQGLYQPEIITYTPAARKFLDGIGDFSYFGSLPIDAQIGIDIVGDFGATSAYQGDGSVDNPYRWFSFAPDTTNRKINLDFSKCNKINLSCPGNSTNIIFYTTDLSINGINISARSIQSNCNIEMIRGANNKGRVYCSDCRFNIETTLTARIAEHGTFTNCYGYLVSEQGQAYCFKPKNTGLIRLNSGEYYAYGRTSSGIGSAISHTSESEIDAVLIANNIHCPVVTKANYSQGFLSVANAGTTYINGCVSRLTNSGEYNQIQGLITKDKA